MNSPPEKPELLHFLRQDSEIPSGNQKSFVFGSEIEKNQPLSQVLSPISASEFKKTEKYPFNQSNMRSFQEELSNFNGFLGTSGKKPKSHGGSFKNAYINKIKYMKKNIKDKERFNQKRLLLMDLKKGSPFVREDEQSLEEELYFEGNMNSCDFNLLTESEKMKFKLAKNRESARNSRQRKKEYFEMLEIKVIELTEELNSAKKKIKQLEESNEKLGFHSKFLTNMLHEKKVLFDRLVVASQKGEETDLIVLLESLTLMRQTLQRIYLEVDPKVQVPTLSKRLVSSFSKYKTLVDSMNNIRKEIRHEALNVTEAADEISKFLTIQQATKLVLSVEQFGVQEEMGQDLMDMEEENKSTTTKNERIREYDNGPKKKRPYNKRKRPKETPEQMNF